MISLTTHPISVEENDNTIGTETRKSINSTTEVLFIRWVMLTLLVGSSYKRHSEDGSWSNLDSIKFLGM